MNILVVNALIWSQWLQSSPSCRRSAAPFTPSEAPRALRSLILRRVRYAGAKKHRRERWVRLHIVAFSLLNSLLKSENTPDTSSISTEPQQSSAAVITSLHLHHVRRVGATAPPRTATSYPYLASRSSQIKDNETHIQSLHEEAVKAALQVMAEWFVLSPGSGIGSSHPVPVGASQQQCSHLCISLFLSPSLPYPPPPTSLFALSVCTSLFALSVSVYVSVAFLSLSLTSVSLCLCL
mmetsp:Transcript_74598/g.199702  ORF Transcript_74598/g.199702 Transcript_74598/m.199702 type:complete len:237 (-) Transcript_74598:357-1067(-)